MQKIFGVTLIKCILGYIEVEGGLEYDTIQSLCQKMVVCQKSVGDKMGS